MSDQARLRRYQDTLRISGIAVLALSVWAAAKSLIYVKTSPASTAALLNFVFGTNVDVNGQTFIFTALAVVFLVDLLLRLIVSSGARAEAKGVRRGPLYLVVAFVLLAVNLVSLALTIFEGMQGGGILQALVNGLVDITSVAVLADLLNAAINVRRLSAAQESGV